MIRHKMAESKRDRLSYLPRCSIGHFQKWNLGINEIAEGKKIEEYQEWDQSRISGRISEGA